MTTQKQANDLLEVRLTFAQGKVDKLLALIFNQSSTVCRIEPDLKASHLDNHSAAKAYHFVWAAPLNASPQKEALKMESTSLLFTINLTKGHRTLTARN
jgi:hypothetical protein